MRLRGRIGLVARGVHKLDRALESPICSGIVFVHLTG
jgi:hypothetical protein